MEHLKSIFMVLSSENLINRMRKFEKRTSGVKKE